MSNLRITLPTYMGLRDWADQITLDLDPFGAFGRWMMLTTGRIGPCSF
jgi:hypothetical protein